MTNDDYAKLDAFLVDNGPVSDEDQMDAVEICSLGEAPTMEKILSWLSKKQPHQQDELTTDFK